MKRKRRLASNRRLALGAATASIALASVGHAENATLTFEGVGNYNYVGSYYTSAYGLSFVDMDAGVASTAGGTFNWTNLPSPSTAAYNYYYDPGSTPYTYYNATLDAPYGITSFSTYYTNPNGDTDIVRVYSGLDGSGTLLGSATLGTTSGGYGNYSSWSNVVPSFSGIAHSIVFQAPGDDTGWDNMSMNLARRADWNAAVTGTWGLGSSWIGGSAPTTADSATFSLANAYTVNFTAPAVAQSINVSAGSPQFNLGGQTLNIYGVDTPLLVTGSGSGPRVTIDGGGNGSAGGTINFTGNPTSGHTWPSLDCGGSGTGTLIIQNGAVINSPSGYIQAGGVGGNGSGVVQLTDAYTTVNVANTYVGNVENGTMHIYSGSTINTGNFTVAAAAQGIAVIGNGIGTSTVNASGGIIALGGYYDGNGNQNGYLEIDTGGVATAGATHVWNSSSHINLSGGTLNTGTLDTGNDATRLYNQWASGTLNLTNSGLTIGAGELGTNVVLGSSKRLSVSGATTVDSTGTLNVSGGIFTAASLSLASGSSSSETGGTISVGSLASSGSALLNWSGGALQITNGNLTIGAGPLGASVAIVSPKYLYVSGTTTVDGTGTIRIGADGTGSLTSGSLSLASGSTYNQSGGYVSVGSINSSGSNNVSWTGGSLTITNSSLTVGSGGVFGPTLTLGSAKALFLTENGQSLNVTGALTLAGGSITTNALTLSGGSFNWASGTLSVIGTGSSFGGTLTVPSAGTLQLNGSITDPVAVNSGGLFNMDASPTTGILVRNLNTITLKGGTTPYGQINMIAATNHSNRQLVVMAGLSIAGGTNAWQGQIDLANNDMDIQGVTTLANVTNQIAEGFNGGKWNGSAGIISTSSATDTSHLTAVGVIQNNQGGSVLYSSFDGYTGTTAVDVLVKYTYYGDTNLDGKVDGSDYGRIDASFMADQNNPSAYTGWFNGDFNYDGFVNGSDYTLIDNAFNSQGAALTAEMATATAEISPVSVAVPEPANLLTAILSVALLSTRRKRKTDVAKTEFGAYCLRWGRELNG